MSYLKTLAKLGSIIYVIYLLSLAAKAAILASNITKLLKKNETSICEKIKKKIPEYKCEK